MPIGEQTCPKTDLLLAPQAFDPTEEVISGGAEIESQTDPIDEQTINDARFLLVSRS